MTRAGAVGNLPWVRGTSQPGVRMAPRGAQHKEAITAELIAEATKIGGKKFIQKFGLDSWRSIATAVTGGTIGYRVSESIDDTTHKSVTDTPAGLVIGGEKKEPLPPPEPFTTPVDTPQDTTLKTPIPEKIDTTLSTPIPEKEDTTLSTPIPKESGPIVYTKDDISKQTEELVPDTTADVSKEKVDKYFEGIDELYDNEWYGSAKSIRDFIDNTTVDNGDKVYDIQKSMYTSYGMERPIHEFFEDEYQGGVGNLGNKDAAMVMQMGDLYKLGEFNGPEYYQEYIDKLHEYTLNTLGKEFKVYRLTRKDEMEAFLNPDRPEEATDTKSFSLSKNRALAFQGLWHDLFTTKEGKPREDLVLIETVVPYDSLIMRGHSGEHEIVVNGEFLSGNEINFYDLKGNLIQGATEGPLVKPDITKQTKELVPEKPEFKYPTKEEQAEYLKEENIFWDKNIKKANEAHPKLQIKNLKKIVEADKHFGAAAMSFESYAESQLIYLTPQEYLDLTKEFGRTDGTWSQGGKLRIEDLERIITEGKELANIPTLYVKKEGENYIVDGQEGRHRSQAFQNLGYDLIPVVIQGTGKDKVADIENKVYTATKRSYLYTEDWTQDYIGFIPKNIISKSNYNEDTKEYEDTEVKSVKPEDFYSVRGKKKLFVKEDTTPGIGHNQPPSSIEEQTDDLVTKTKTKHYKGKLTATDTLNSDLMDALAKLTGTPEDIAKSSKLPQSHKKKIFWSLEDYITKHYPAKLNAAESDHEGEALFYITSAIYDAYTSNGKVPSDVILVEDDKGIPMGAAEIEIYPKGKVNFYPKRKTNKTVKTEPAIYIEGIGSFNRKTTDLLLEKIEFLAEAEGIRYIVGEDLTSEGALKALSLRGFKPSKKGFFEGELINEAMWRGGKKGIKAKNMVLDLGEKYATTQEEINKELEKEHIQEQTEKLISKITLEKVRSDVKFKQSKYANTTDVYYKGKKYAEIEKRPDKEKYKGLSDYDLKYPSGTFLENGEEVFTTEDAWLGFKDAKDALINSIYNDLKRKK